MLIPGWGACPAAVAWCFRDSAGLERALCGGSAHPTSHNGALGKRGKQADSSVSWHILAAEQPPELAASLCSLEQLGDIFWALPVATIFDLKLVANSQRRGKILLFPPSQQRMLRTAPTHSRIQHWESWPRLSFSRHILSALFSDPMLGKPSAASVQGRGVLQHGCRLSLLPPFAYLWQPMNHRMLPLPWWELQSHGTLLSAAMLGIQLQPHGFFHPSRVHTYNLGWLVSTENRSSKSLQGHTLGVQRIAQSAVWFAYGTPGGLPRNFILMVKALVSWGQH